MRFFGKENYEAYFSYLEENKYNTAINIETAIRYIYTKTESVEASFYSKLLHMIDTNRPILDLNVRRHFKIKNPSSHKHLKTKPLNGLEYDSICEWYKVFFQTEKAKECIALFNKYYPEATISDTKKIDFILWQIRSSVI